MSSPSKVSSLSRTSTKVVRQLNKTWANGDDSAKNNGRLSGIEVRAKKMTFRSRDHQETKRAEGYGDGVNEMGRESPGITTMSKQESNVDEKKSEAETEKKVHGQSGQIPTILD